VADRTWVQADARLVDAWFVEKMGCGVPNPFDTSLDQVARHNQERARLLYDCLGDIGLGGADPKLQYAVPQYGNRLICAAAFGAPHPQWDERTGSFWLDSATPAWSGITNVAEVDRLSIPNWAENPLVKENIEKWEEVKRVVGAQRAYQMPLDQTELFWEHPLTQARFRFCVYATFIDLGSFLMNNTEFMTILGGDPELAHALLRKCFQLSTSLTEFLRHVYDRPMVGWGSLGGDNSCLLSPSLYVEYGMGFDTLMREAGGNLPRNLHSCGASRHLYGVWADYTEHDQIVLMQTRAIPGAMEALRQSLPQTYIQLTLHQPQVDFEHETPERIREIVWQCAEDLGFRDMSITVLFSTVNEQSKANLAAFFSAIEEVNAEAGEGARR